MTGRLNGRKKELERLFHSAEYVRSGEERQKTRIETEIIACRNVYGLQNLRNRGNHSEVFLRCQNGRIVPGLKCGFGKTPLKLKKARFGIQVNGKVKVL